MDQFKNINYQTTMNFRKFTFDISRYGETTATAHYKQGKNSGRLQTNNLQNANCTRLTTIGPILRVATRLRPTLFSLQEKHQVQHLNKIHFLSIVFGNLFYDRSKSEHMNSPSIKNTRIHMFLFFSFPQATFKLNVSPKKKRVKEFTSKFFGSVQLIHYQHNT